MKIINKTFGNLFKKCDIQNENFASDIQYFQTLHGYKYIFACFTRFPFLSNFYANTYKVQNKSLRQLQGKTQIKCMTMFIM